MSFVLCTFYFSVELIHLVLILSGSHAYFTLNCSDTKTSHQASLYVIPYIIAMCLLEVYRLVSTGSTLTV